MKYELSQEEKRKREPLPLESLFDAICERQHKEPGRGRAARVGERNGRNVKRDT
jgi:hypothetical protein